MNIDQPSPVVEDERSMRVIALGLTGAALLVALLCLAVGLT